MSSVRRTVYNLVTGTDVEATNAKVTAYQRENSQKIRQQLTQRAAEDRRVVDNLKRNRADVLHKQKLDSSQVLVTHTRTHTHEHTRTHTHTHTHIGTHTDTHMGTHRMRTCIAASSTSRHTCLCASLRQEKRSKHAAEVTKQEEVASLVGDAVAASSRLLRRHPMDYFPTPTVVRQPTPKRDAELRFGLLFSVRRAVQRTLIVEASACACRCVLG